MTFDKNGDPMRKMDVALIAMSTLFASSLLASDAKVNIKKGEYILGNCKVSVIQGWKENTLQIRVDHLNRAEFGEVVLDQTTQKLVSVNSCNYYSPNQYPLIANTSSKSDESTKYEIRCGGIWHVIDGKASLKIDHHSGLVTAFNVSVKIAMASFPGGANSGPIKTTLDRFNCQL